MRRSTVLSLLPQLVFPGLYYSSIVVASEGVLLSKISIACLVFSNFISKNIIVLLKNVIVMSYPRKVKKVYFI
jgi:hypothetical protein